jgi:hypothetical protein
MNFKWIAKLPPGNNRCFINSALQMLFLIPCHHLPSIKKFIAHINLLQENNKNVNIFTIPSGNEYYQEIMNELFALKFISSNAHPQQDDATFLFDNIMDFYIENKFIKNIYKTGFDNAANDAALILYYVSMGEKISMFKEINGQKYLAIGWFHHYGNHWNMTVNITLENGACVHYSLDDDNLYKKTFLSQQEFLVDPTIKALVYAKTK